MKGEDAQSYSECLAELRNLPEHSQPLPQGDEHRTDSDVRGEL